MILERVDPNNPHHVLALYEMLKEREPSENISHKALPSFAEHTSFVVYNPQKRDWYLVTDEGNDYIRARVVGNVYITDRREVGIHIRPAERANGVGSAALKMLRDLHPGPLYANINPLNTRSIEFFLKHGATLLQLTYALPEVPHGS